MVRLTWRRVASLLSSFISGLYYCHGLSHLARFVRNEHVIHCGSQDLLILEDRTVIGDRDLFTDVRVKLVEGR
jgi:hypothetical protein